MIQQLPVMMGSCIYPSNCTSPKPTLVLYAFDVIDTRAKVGWDNMNDSNCMVWKYFKDIEVVGTSQWITKISWCRKLSYVISD